MGCNGIGLARLFGLSVVKLSARLYMYEIVRGLYLASYKDVLNEREKVTSCYIINCTKDFPMVHANSMRLPINDDLSQESYSIMYSNLPNLMLIIDNKLKNNLPVVVHCAAGQQRSAAVVCAYVMWKTCIKLEDAISYIKSKKIDAFFWNVNFRPPLEMFAQLCCKS